MSNTILPPKSRTALESGTFKIEIPRIPSGTDMDPVALGILDTKAAADTRKRLARVADTAPIRFRRSPGVAS